MMEAAKFSIMNPLEERIFYKFRNSLLLAEALTHPSISLERKSFHSTTSAWSFSATP